MSPRHEMARDCPSGDNAGAEASWTASEPLAGKGIEAMMNNKQVQPSRLANENMVLVLSNLCGTVFAWWEATGSRSHDGFS